MRMRDLFIEDERAAIKPSASRKGDYQSKFPKKAAYQDGSRGRDQEPKASLEAVKPIDPVKPVAPATPA